jgi:O-antigen/teichoic acid export membrane protein
MKFTFLELIYARLGLRPAAARVIETMAVTILILCLNIATGVFTARWLGPAARGEQAAIQFWVLPIVMLFSFGVPASSIYVIKYRGQMDATIYASIFLLILVCALLGSIVGVIVSPYLLLDYSDGVRRGAQWIMLLVLPAMVFHTGLFVLRGREDFFVFNLARTLYPVLTLLSLIFFLAIGHLTPFTAAMSYPASAVLLGPLIACKIVSSIKPVFSQFCSNARQLLSYGLRVHGKDSVRTVANALDAMFVITMLPLASVGFYVVARSMGQALQQVGFSISMVLLPKITNVSESFAVDIATAAARFSLLGSAVLGGVLVLFAPLLLRVLYGESFLEAVDIFRILAVAVLLRITSEMLMQAFLALGRPGVVSILEAVTLVIKMALLIVLITHFGANGAAIATLVSEATLFLCLYFCFPTILKGKSPNLIITRADFLLLRKKPYK